MLLMKHHATVAVIPPVKPLKSHHVEKNEQSQNYFSPLFINHLTTIPSLLCIISFYSVPSTYIKYTHLLISNHISRDYQTKVPHSTLR